MPVSALSCKIGKSRACCKINYMTCKYALIALLECCAVLCMKRKHKSDPWRKRCMGLVINYSR